MAVPLLGDLRRQASGHGRPTSMPRWYETATKPCLSATDIPRSYPSELLIRLPATTPPCIARSCSLSSPCQQAPNHDRSVARSVAPSKGTLIGGSAAIHLQFRPTHTTPPTSATKKKPPTLRHSPPHSSRSTRSTCVVQGMNR